MVFVLWIFCSESPSSTLTSTSDETATYQAKVCANAAKVFGRGNKKDKEFSATIVKKIRKLKKKKFHALAALEDVESTTASRKRVRERVESLIEEESIQKNE